MSFGEGNLHERVDELERENAELRGELAGFEVVPHIDARTRKGKLAARDKRIAELEELLDSAHQTIGAMRGKLVELESLARDARAALVEVAGMANGEAWGIVLDVGERMDALGLTKGE